MSGKPARATRPGTTAWDAVPDRLRAGGLRWTSQRATLITVLRGTVGHVTGSQLIERCRELQPATTPSTVYRTLDVLEAIGLISHSHGLDGREEYHVQAGAQHGHLVCSVCGSDEDLGADEASDFVAALRRDRGFTVQIDHLTVTGRCRTCSAAGTAPA